MVRTASPFSQLLEQLPRSEFAKLVQAHVMRRQFTFLSRPGLQTYTSSFACSCNRYEVWTISQPGNRYEVFHGNGASVL